MEQKYDSKTIPQQGNQNEIALKHLYSIIRRSLLRISLLTVLTAFLAAIFIAQLPAVYKATAVVQLQTQAVQVQTKQASQASVKEVLQNEVSRNDYFQTQIEILRSDQITEKVVSQLKLRQHPYYTQPAQTALFIRGLNSLMCEFKILADWALLIQLRQALQPDIQQQSMPPDAQAFNTQIKSAISINPVKSKQLININYEHRNPELAALIANAYVSVYIQHDRDFHAQQTINASQWLEEGVQVLKKNFNDAEQNLADFLQQENLLNDNDVEQLTANELKYLAAELNQNRSEKLIAEALYQQTSQETNQEKNVNKELILIKKNELAIMAALEQKKAEYRKILEHNARYNTLSQELASSRELYHMFLSQLKESRLKESSLTNVINQSVATLASTATPPLSPFKPKRILIFVLVVLLTIIILILHALLRAFYHVTQDNIIKLNPILLGTLPNLKSADRQFKQLSPQQLFQSNKTIYEAAQSLRTSLQMSTLGQKQQIIVITSATVGEGKSTAAIYLAMALAQSKKTIIIDADMRKPSIGKKMGIPKTHTGLSDILAKGGSLSDSIWYDEQTKLGVMPAGERPDNPLNLFRSKRFKSCLTILKSQYDYIIIDSPPSQPVSDTYIIGQSADINIVVTRSNHSKKNEIDDSIAQLAKHNITVNGIILNNASLLDGKRYQYQNHKKIP